MRGGACVARAQAVTEGSFQGAGSLIKRRAEVVDPKEMARRGRRALRGGAPPSMTLGTRRASQVQPLTRTSPSRR